MFDEIKFAELTTGLDYQAIFVPKSLSRNKDEKSLQINWVINLRLNNQLIQIEYSMGLGCMSDKNKRQLEAFCGKHSQYQGKTVARAEAEQSMVEVGKIPLYANVISSGHTIDKPPLKNIVHALLIDSEAIDFASFEDWAECFGYSADSIKAKSCYDDCLAIALKMRAMFGDKFAELKELFLNF